MTNNDKIAEGSLVLSPKASFILGLVGGVMVLCTIGFFILLGMVMNGSVSSDARDAAPSIEVNDPSPSAAAPANVDPIDSEEAIWGDEDAEVSLIIYSDIECPFCGRFHDTVKSIQRDYAGDVKIAFRHFPLSFHPQAMPAALAAECAAEQGKLWEFLDEMFADQSLLGEAYFKSTAKSLGMNASKFNSCFDDQKYAAKINADRSSGAAAGVSGTPGSFIIGADGRIQNIPGALPYEQVKPMIEAAL